MTCGQFSGFISLKIKMRHYFFQLTIRHWKYKVSWTRACSSWPEDYSGSVETLQATEFPLSKELFFIFPWRLGLRLPPEHRYEGNSHTIECWLDKHHISSLSPFPQVVLDWVIGLFIVSSTEKHVERLGLCNEIDNESRCCHLPLALI